MNELSPAARIAFGENSMLDIKNFFDTSERPLEENEFRDFWMSLSKEERDEYRKADLS